VHITQFFSKSGPVCWQWVRRIIYLKQFTLHMLSLRLLFCGSLGFKKNWESIYCTPVFVVLWWGTTWWKGGLGSPCL